MLKESTIMKRIASLVLLVLLLILVIIFSTSSTQTSNQSFGFVEIPMGCNVPQERIDGFVESEFRGREDENGTYWWKVNYNLGGSPHWMQMPGPKTMCSPTGEVIRINH